MDRLDDGDLTIFTAGPVGFGNNIFIVLDRATGESAFVDAPGSAEELIAAAQEAGVTPRAILLTHSHFDHTPGIDGLKQKWGCHVYAGAAETNLAEGHRDTPVAHGDSVKVGSLVFRALHVPGHTPGSTTYVTGAHAFVGDTLFPGGPGRSGSNELLQQEIGSITTHLYALGDNTTVWPGHGATTTIGLSKAEYEVFAAKEHGPALQGDVSWLDS